MATERSKTWRPTLLPLAAAAALVGLLGAVLAAPEGAVLGTLQTDAGQQFLAWRAFARASLLSGHLPTWNPWVFSGAPFLGTFQSALFYPVRILAMALETPRGLNLEVSLDLWVLGTGVGYGLSRRGLHPLACLGAAVAAPLCGPVFPHVYAGHLPNLGSLAWAPWVVAGLVDAWEGEALRGVLVASAAVALQVLAGHVQYVYDTAVMGLVVAAVWLVARRQRPLARVAGVLVGVYGLGMALSLVQLLPGYLASQEGLRQGSLPRAFAAQFSLPPENLATLAAPEVFGTVDPAGYWGRCYPWEMSLFVGTPVLVLAMAAVAGGRHRRAALAGLCVAAVGIVLALGAHTPLFDLLRAWVPFWDRFRGMSKFTFAAALAILGVAALGADCVARGDRFPKVGWCSAILGAALAALGLWIRGHPSLLSGLDQWIGQSQERYAPHASLAEGAAVCGASIAVAGGFMVVSGACLLGAAGPNAQALRWVVVALGPVPLLLAARGEWATFDGRAAVAPEVSSWLERHPGPARIQNLIAPNNGFLSGRPDIWGNDPGIPLRYAQFMAYSQGVDPGLVDANLVFRRPSPMLRLVRLGAVVTHPASGVRVYDIPGGLPRTLLVPRADVIAKRDNLLKVLGSASFVPTERVLLESTAALPKGTDPSIAGPSVSVSDLGPDSTVVSVETPAPCFLLMTDGYSRGWKADSFPGSSQEHYEVLPADAILRATPLGPGRHRIHFHYDPPGFVAGVIASLVAWVAWLFGVILAAKYGAGKRRAAS